jgi:3-oxoacyl-[acyl-carrier-protein] synthase-3
LGSGSQVPDRILTNQELAKLVETTDEWITVRTGIKERRILEEGKGASDLAYEASKKALEDAGVDPQDLDAIIVGTASPDYPFPSTGSLLEAKLKAKKAFSFDVNAACSGFIHAIAIADSMVQAGKADRVLVVGCDVLSRFLNWKDRTTCILFADGAGAVVLARGNQERSGILATYLGGDGNFAKTLYVPAGGSLCPHSVNAARNHQNTIHMQNGKEVFKIAVRSMEDASLQVIAMAGVKIEDIRLVIPHQANLRIITALAQHLGVPMDRVFVNIEKYGNTSAASVPIALDEARRCGRTREGDLVLINSFGAGFAWGAALIRL